MIFTKRNSSIVILVLTTLSHGLNCNNFAIKTRNITTMPAELKKLTMDVWCAGSNKFTRLCHGFPDYQSCIGEVIQEELFRVLDNIDLYEYSAFKIGKNLLSTKCEEEKNTPQTPNFENVSSHSSYWFILVASLVFFPLLAVVFIGIRRRSRFDYNTRNTIINNSGDPKNVMKITSLEEEV